MFRSYLLRSRWSWPLASGLLVAPFVLNGCGGGSSGPNVQPTATPVATVAPTATAVPTAVVQPVQVPINLGNGQNAQLEISPIVNNQLIGALIVSAAQAQNAAKVGRQAFSFVLPAGRYEFRGTITPPRSYQGSGTGPGNFRFTVNGLLPTTTQTGTYTLNANNQSVTGIIPAGAIPGL